MSFLPSKQGKASKGVFKSDGPLDDTRHCRFIRRPLSFSWQARDGTNERSFRSCETPLKSGFADAESPPLTDRQTDRLPPADGADADGVKEAIAAPRRQRRLQFSCGRRGHLEVQFFFQRSFLGNYISAALRSERFLPTKKNSENRIHLSLELTTENSEREPIRMDSRQKR